MRGRDRPHGVPGRKAANYRDLALCRAQPAEHRPWKPSLKGDGYGGPELLRLTRQRLLGLQWLLAGPT
ncbi:MAG: hypothetical protein ACE5JU_10090 [Candidatus Binatia bacterium]